MSIDVGTIGGGTVDFSTSGSTVDVFLETDSLGFGYGLPGPPGPQGPQGERGPTGPAGPTGGNYRHVQSQPGTQWDITHGLDFFPNVTVIDSAGTVVEGEIEFIDRNNIRLRFSEAFAGDAYLS